LPATEAEIIPLEERRPSAEALAASKRMPKRDRSQLDDSKPLPPRPQPVAAQPHAEEHKPESGNPDSAQPAVAAAAPVSAVAGGDAVDSHAESAPQAETASRSETVMQPPQLEVDTRPESVEPVMAQAAAAEEAVEADEAPEAAVPEPETGSDIDDAQAQEAAAADAGGAPKRAYNDPREVRRRAREAQLKAQGVMPRAGDQS
jgi:ribonuclease E